MSDLYKMTSTVREMTSLFGNFEGDRSNLNPLNAIYPGQIAPVLANTGDHLALTKMTWGLPGWTAKAAPITNVHNPRSNFWKLLLAEPEHRCLVPVTKFCKWNGPVGSKQKFWFGLVNEPLFAFAGIWRLTDDGPRYAFLTCKPNNMATSIYPNDMPVILRAKDYGGWLSGGNVDTITTPFPSDELVIGA